MNTKQLHDWYEKNYILPLVITIIIFVVALVLIGVKYAHDGEIVKRGVSLQGGVIVTIASNSITEDALKNIHADFKKIDEGIFELQTTNTEESFVKDLTEKVDALQLAEDEVSIEKTGSSLGSRFFSQMRNAILFALVFMAVAVYVSFRKIIPSLTIITAVIIDMTITLAIFNMTGYALSASGIAAFLMIIGYAVDTNILLSTRALKDHSVPMVERLFSSTATGLTMIGTTLASLLVALIFTNSQIIFQIALILVIGLVVDMLTTWGFNTGVLMWYDKKVKKHD